jgi:hypothetical protein
MNIDIIIIIIIIIIQSFILTVREHEGETPE